METRAQTFDLTLRVTTKPDPDMDRMDLHDLQSIVTWWVTNLDLDVTVVEAYEIGEDCPEMCGHGGQCAKEAAAISEAERYAEGSYDRMMEQGYPGYDYDPNDRGGWAGTGEDLR